MWANVRRLWTLKADGDNSQGTGTSMTHSA